MRKRRIIALILAVVMILSVLNMPVGRSTVNAADDGMWTVTFRSEKGGLGEEVVGVSFDLNGGTTDKDCSEPFYLLPGECFIERYGLVEPTKDGAAFDGWLNTETGKIYSHENVVYDISYNADTKYQAVWTDDWILFTFDANGGIFDNDQYIIEKKIKHGKYNGYAPYEPFLENKLFVGWKDNNGTYYRDGEISGTFESDTTFTAQWADTVTVTYDANGGKFYDGSSTYINELIPNGVEAYYWPDEPKTDGMLFAGWKINGTGELYSSDEIANYVFNQDTKLVAQWKVSYIITFVSSDGYINRKEDNTEYSCEIMEGSSIGSLPYCGGRPGYVFSHWEYNGEEIDYTYIPSGNITVYAVWEKGVNVTFDYDGGYVTDPDGIYERENDVFQVAQNSKINRSPYNIYSIKKDDQIIKCWKIRNSDGTLGEEEFSEINISFYEVGTEDVTFVAQYADDTNTPTVNDTNNPTVNTTNKPTANSVLTTNTAKKKTTTTTTAKKSTPKYSEEWVKGKWYNKDGSQTYKGTMSWKSNAKGWWIEDTAGWYPTSTWQKIDGVWYYFNSSGYMASNEWYDGYWFNSDGSWDSTYKMSWKGNSIGWWIEDKSGWWPSNSWQKIDGKWYYFKGDGYLATSQYVGGYWVDSNGVCQ